MTKLFLLCTLVAICIAPAFILTSSDADAQQVVYEETAYNNQNQLFIRLANYSNNWVACYYSDAYNYLTFSIAPQTVTQWQPVYGVYTWECRYY